ncbi:MAG: hypothetical protein H6719_05435 [Sandaracinaceae bacterium]|nr:hypothetical protein [Sandaracinaceae bacterium]
MDERCDSCGRTYRPDDEFCGGCGTPRAKPEAPLPAAAATPTATPTATPGVPVKRSIRGRLMFLVSAIIPIGIVIMSLKDCGSAEGQMVVSGSPHGEWTFVPTGCASMQPYGFVGANLHADGHNDGGVYVTLDHVHGHKVELEVPGSCRNADGTDCTVFEVPRDACQVFDVAVENSGTVVNDVRLVDGHVHLQCELPDGTTVSGTITFEGC